jgi:hypothetical protein
MSKLISMKEECANCRKPYGLHASAGDYCPASDGLLNGEWRETKFRHINQQPPAEAKQKYRMEIKPYNSSARLVILEDDRPWMFSYHDKFEDAQEKGQKTVSALNAVSDKEKAAVEFINTHGKDIVQILENSSFNGLFSRITIPLRQLLNH